jgi:hypothetical protein
MVATKAVTHSAAVFAILAVLFNHCAHAAEPFDGEWDTSLSCPNIGNALGYSFEFPTSIRDGVLHGEKGTKGQPGWLQLDGTVSPDGRATIYASGLVGASEAAVGHRPAGTQYGYHLEIEFTGASGKGRRVEGRPCTVTLARKK